jgi:hypothetical protein
METEALGLVHELWGRIRRCGRGKWSGRTFCARCYYALPPPLRRALYRGVGSGYEEAYAEAAAYLGEAPP